MDITLVTDPNLTPHPRGDIRILKFNITPYEDNHSRYRANIELTAFTPVDKPSLLLTVSSPTGEELTSAHIVETMHRDIAITLHVTNSQLPKELIFRADLYFEEDAVQHSAEAIIRLDKSDG
jgi:hypothetical protein